MSATFEPIVGRYMHLELFGRPHRIYVEQAGEGTPLLCLHTAGSDGRQYRGLMNDSRVTSRHRVIAFDMPWHGKSSPPEGWHEEEYQLTSAQYATMILNVMKALELDRPILIGCSIGGRICLHLALEHPEHFRAIIGLQAGAHVDPYYDLNFLHRPDVHGGEVAGAIVSGLVGPDAPDKERWETLWHYMQSGPGVFKGDLYFYKVDGDIRKVAEKLSKFDEVVYVVLTAGTVDLLAEVVVRSDLALLELVQVLAHLLGVLLIGDEADQHGRFALGARLLQVDHRLARRDNAWSTTSSISFGRKVFLYGIIRRRPLVTTAIISSRESVLTVRSFAPLMPMLPLRPWQVAQ